jgi:ABC-2 type transport system permease protein
LVSGVYYPLDVLPGWLQPLAALSPATYALSACRKLIGVGVATTPQGEPIVTPISAVSSELLALTLMGIIMIPLGLWVFGYVENWAKRTGKLKRTG